MNLLHVALQLAYDKHLNQVDKGNKPYILHPITVALDDTLTDSDEKIIAILHDILEDTDVTEEDLLNFGFSQDIVDTISLLTKPNDMDYFDYIRNIKSSGNVIAFWVKVADLKHNSDLSRLNNVTQKDIQRVHKYKKALDILYGNEK